MFVITTKVSKTKLAAGVTLFLAAVVLGAVLFAARAKPEDQTVKNGDTNEARITFLTQQGWQVNGEPVQTQSVKVPGEDSEAFRRYNSLQKSQGFDLTPYAGQQVRRYVYEILNYPDTESPVYATLFVKDGRIIGGDVTDTAPEGKMQGLGKEGAGPKGA